MTTQPAKKRSFISILGAFFVICCICSVISGIVNNLSGKTKSAEQTDTAVALLPTGTPAPTETPAPPTATLSPLEGLKAQIVNILSNDPKRLTAFEWAESDNFLYIEFSISDNFTSSLIVTGIKSDITQMLRSVSTSGLLPTYQDVTISGKFPLVDKFGNKSDEIVLTVSYTRATVDKINWDNFQYPDILDIADTVYIHPALKKVIQEAGN